MTEAGIGFAIGAILSLLLWFNALADWQRRGADLLYPLGSAATSGQVVIVAVDDRSLAELGRWDSWPRVTHARLVDVLRQAGARVIALDFLLSEPSADDELLAESLRQAGNVILPVVGVARAPRRASAGHPITFDTFLTPAPALARSAAALGHVNADPDADSLVRRLPVGIASAETGAEMPSFALAAVVRYLRLPDVDYASNAGVVRLAGRRIPVDNFDRMLIRFIGPPSHPGTGQTFPMYSYADILHGRVEPAALHDKIVLVGIMASGMLDSFPTPMGSDKMYGVEIYANIIDSTLQGRFLREEGLPGQLALVLLTALASAILLSRFHPVTAGGACVLMAAGYGLAASAAFEQGVVLNLIYPLLALISVYIAVLIYRYVTESRRRLRLTHLFGRYVSPAVVREVLASSDAGELRLGGTTREATVLFADIRDFCRLAYGSSPDQVVATLNTYLSALVEVIDRHEGTVNKFIGDSVMAIWNAPLDQPDHAQRAVSAACEMQQVIRRLGTGPSDVSAISFGIGVNSGEMVAGNVGSRQRMEYTVIGDAVNIASRLCEQARPGQILIGARTCELIGGAVAVQECPLMSVRDERGTLPAYLVVE